MTFPQSPTTPQKKWYKWTYLQNKKRHIDLENKLNGYQGGGQGWGGERIVISNIFFDLSPKVVEIKMKINKWILSSVQLLSHI